MATSIIFRVWQASWTFDFFNDFLKKDSALSPRSGNPIDFFHPLGWHLKIGPKSKKIVRNYKNGTKTGKPRVWNEL